MENNDFPAVYDLQQAQSLLSALPSDTQSPLRLFLKLKVLWLSHHPTEALGQFTSLPADIRSLPRFMELEADCYLRRFVVAPPGMAQKDDLLNAEAHYQAIIADNPDYNNLGWVYYQLGRCYLLLDNVEMAATAFRSSLTRPSTHPEVKPFVYERLGYIEFYHQRNFKQAIAMLNLAVAVHPTDVSNQQWLIQTHLFRSRVMQSIGQYEQAAQTITYIIEQAHKLHQATILRDTLLAASELLTEINGYESQALSYLKEYTSLSPVPTGHNITWSRVQEMIGNLHYKLRHYGEAANAYQQAIDFNPNHPWQVSIYYRLAQCYYQQGNYQSVIATIQRLLKSAVSDGQTLTDFRVYDILGSAYFAVEQYHNAADAYKKALEYIPQTSENLEKIRLYYHFSLQLMNR